MSQYHRAQVTLTCNANDVNPTGDGMEVTCTVTNSYNNNQQRSHTYQLNLNCES